MTEFILGPDAADEQPVTHYMARVLKLSLTALNVSYAEFSVVAQTEPGDYELMARMSDDDSINSDLGSQFTGGENPVLTYDAEQIEAAIRLARQIAESALTLTENDYPPLRIQLDSELAVHAHDILGGISSRNPQGKLL